MTAVPASLCCTLLLLTCVFAEQQTMTAQSGQTVTLTCQAKTDRLDVVDWSRSHMEEDVYVLFYRDGRLDPDNQHPSFKNRAELKDRQMTGGDVSLILKEVTAADSGTYECRIRGKSRSVLGSVPVSSITLRVSPPPGGAAAVASHLSVSAGLLAVAVFAF